MNGCRQTKCPCKGLWVNCAKYNNWKRKQYHIQEYAELNDWYITNFRIKYEHGESYSNG